MKTCCTCKEEKDFLEFHKDSGKKDGFRAECKTCTSIRSASYRDKNREKLKSQWREASKKYYVNGKREKLLLKKYGITADEYDRMFEEQGGKCKICGDKQEDKKLAVDHCHDTGNVRGLLCNFCNLGLGYFKDNILYMNNAISYIQSFAGTPATMRM
jgi:hypothetical protein